MAEPGILVAEAGYEEAGYVAVSVRHHMKSAVQQHLLCLVTMAVQRIACSYLVETSPAVGGESLQGVEGVE